MKRRSFIASVGAAFAALFAPKLAVESAPNIVEAAASVANPAAGAFLAAKTAEIDALYAEMARNLAVYTWGNPGDPIAKFAGPTRENEHAA